MRFLRGILPTLGLVLTLALPALADNQPKPELYKQRRDDRGVLMAPAGSAGIPSIALERTDSGENEGFFLSGTNLAPAICAAINGVSVACFDGSGLVLAGFTPGSVVFIDAFGGLDEDNPNFFWNNTSKRLGIGNNAPDSTLHVTGTFHVTGTSALNGITTVSALVQPNADNTIDLGSVSASFRSGYFQTSVLTTRVAPEAAGVLTLASNGANSVIVETNGSTRLTVSSTGLTTPGADNTQDFGSTALSWASGFFQTAVRTPSVQPEAAGTLTLASNGANSVIIQTNSATWLTIDSTGQVTPGADNTQDLGSVANSFRSLFAQTNVQTPSVIPEAAGTLTLASNGANSLLFNTNGSLRMTISSTGLVTPGANATQDFGATGTRWAKIWAADLETTNAPTVTNGVTRRIFVPITGGINNTGTPTPSQIGGLYFITLSNAASSIQTVGNTGFPADYLSGNITVYMTWSANSTTGNARLQCIVGDLRSNAATATTTLTVTAAANGTLNASTRTSMGTVTPSAANTQVLGFSCGELGADAADTIGAAANLESVEYEYLATR